jgi:hypothetical protein
MALFLEMDEVPLKPRACAPCSSFRFPAQPCEPEPEAESEDGADDVGDVGIEG